MTLTPVSVRPAPHPLPAPPVPVPERCNSAVDHQRVLHQLVRREFAMLADLAGWAPAGDADRAARLSRHAELLARVLIEHHRTEGELLWPAVCRHLPDPEQDATRAAVVDWTGRTAALDRLLRALGTAARQWNLTRAAPAHRAFLDVSIEVTRAVDAHIAVEEERLLPLVAWYLPGQEWTAIRRGSRTPLARPERRLVLGLALEDACAADRARLLAGLPRRTRTAWQMFGRRRYRAAIVRLRGAPPAA